MFLLTVLCLSREIVLPSPYLGGRSVVEEVRYNEFPGSLPDSSTTSIGEVSRRYSFLTTDPLCRDGTTVEWFWYAFSVGHVRSLGRGALGPVVRFGKKTCGSRREYEKVLRSWSVSYPATVLPWVVQRTSTLCPYLLTKIDQIATRFPLL